MLNVEKVSESVSSLEPDLDVWKKLDQELLAKEEQHRQRATRFQRNYGKESAFVLTNASRQRGVLFSPAFSDGNRYRMSVFDAHGFFTHKEDANLFPLLKKAVDEYNVTRRDDDLLEAMRQKPSFIETTMQFWCHNVCGSMADHIRAIVFDAKKQHPDLSAKDIGQNLQAAVKAVEKDLQKDATRGR